MYERGRPTVDQVSDFGKVLARSFACGRSPACDRWSLQRVLASPVSIVKALDWAPSTLACAAARPNHGVMTRWSTNSPYQPSGIDQTPPTRLSPARVVGVIILTVAGLYVAGNIAVFCLNTLIAMSLTGITF
jgi:hypothetical protein